MLNILHRLGTFFLIGCLIAEPIAARQAIARPAVWRAAIPAGESRRSIHNFNTFTSQALDVRGTQYRKTFGEHGNIPAMKILSQSALHESAAPVINTASRSMRGHRIHRLEEENSAAARAGMVWAEYVTEVESELDFYRRANQDGRQARRNRNDTSPPTTVVNSGFDNALPADELMPDEQIERLRALSQLSKKPDEEIRGLAMKIGRYLEEREPLRDEWYSKVKDIAPSRAWIKPYHTIFALTTGIAEALCVIGVENADLSAGWLRRPGRNFIAEVRRRSRDWFIRLERRLYVPEEFDIIRHNPPYRRTFQPASTEEARRWVKTEVTSLGRFLWVPSCGYPPSDIVTALFLQFIQKEFRWFSKARLLELGSASAPVAIGMARVGAYVVAGEINEESARTGEANVTEEPVEVQNRIEMFTSDLCESLLLIVEPFERSFDGVVFVHPIFAMDPESPLDHAAMAGDGFEVLRRTLESLPFVTTLTGGGLFWLSEAVGERLDRSVWNSEHLQRYLPKGWRYQIVHSDESGQRHLVWVERSADSLKESELSYIRKNGDRLPPWSALHAIIQNPKSRGAA